MTFSNFIKDKVYVIVLNLSCAVLLSMFIYLTRRKMDELILILVCWAFIFIIYLMIIYRKQKKKVLEIHCIMDSLDKKYLFVEMLDKPSTVLEQEYYSIMKRSMKSMAEHVSEAERKQREYQEFIEQWVHEIKLPITGMKLICENNKNEYTRKQILQIEEIERHVERVLYYARLGHVEKDYIIKETSLTDIIEEVLAKNKKLLITNNFGVDTSNLHYTVYCDKKWIVFILNQIIINCVQYKKDNPKITIGAYEVGSNIELAIKDNGIGIKKSEISRIFQIGFTGSNGRNSKTSTGIGLYLCKELSQKLGISINAKSELNKYTEIILSFPKDENLDLMKQR